MSHKRSEWYSETAEILLNEQLRRETEQEAQPPTTQVNRELAQAIGFSLLEIGNALNRLADAMQQIADNQQVPRG